MRLLLRMVGVALALLLVVGQAGARPVPPRDAREGVLDATLVVLVTHAAGDSYWVDQTFLGTAKRGDKVKVPQFSLFTAQMYGPPKIDPITPETLILMYLHPKPNSAGSWEITGYGYCFFWENDWSRRNYLSDMAIMSVGLRRCWQTARNIPEPRRRAAALWPFLDVNTYGLNFQQYTKKALQGIRPISGDMMAERFWGMDAGLRLHLLPEMSLYGGDKLHHAIKQYLSQQQKHYDKWHLTKKTAGSDMADDWSQGGPVNDLPGNLRYGVAGLASFHEKSDLPYIREIAMWAVRHHFEDINEATLAAFQQMPDPANLPVIAAIWKAHSEPPLRGYGFDETDIARVLGAHRYAETIPLLARFLIVPTTETSEVHYFMIQIVGKDLGNDPKAWLRWYSQHRPIHH